MTNLSLFYFCQQWNLSELQFSPFCSTGSPAASVIFLITPVLQLITKLFCVIAINIRFPAEVFVHDLSSQFFLIRFC